MTFPLLSSTFADGELVTEAKLYTRVLAVINTLGGFLYGEDEDSASVTLTTTATNFILPNVAVTFTLAAQRRVRFKTSARYTIASAAGNMTVACAYVAGGSATLSGAVILGLSGANQVVTSVTGGGGAVTSHAEHTALIAAGTWTAFTVAARATGGSATDSAAFGYCAVYDAGAT